MTPDQLLARAVDDDPARPLITFYDDATDERAELSVVTFANWVAKTANLLVDGLGAQPGQRLAVRLPVHWQSAVWHAACWATGLVAVIGPDPGPTDIAVLPIDQDHSDQGASTVAPAADEVVGLGLGPLGLPRRDVVLPSHVTLDYDREIRSYGDHFGPRTGDDPDRLVLQVGRDVHRAGDLAEVTAQRLRVWGQPTGARILSMRPFDDLSAIVVGLLAPLANGGGTVLCRRPDLDRLTERTAAERVTAVSRVPPDLLPTLPRVT